MATNGPDSHALVESLVSKVCPACQGEKNERQTFCRKCYYRLTMATRKALYRRIGEGYEEAFAKAMNELSRGELQEDR